jgi:hypothetical protein
MTTIIGSGMGALVFCLYFVARYWPDDLVRASDIVYALVSAYVVALVTVVLLKLWGLE